MEPIKIFASTGKPIMQSASPQMHNTGFAACGGINAVYTRLAADSMEEALEAARQIGMSGLNVTAPFKESACRLADRLDADALATGAVNTLLITPPQVGHFDCLRTLLCGASLRPSELAHGCNTASSEAPSLFDPRCSGVVLADGMVVAACLANASRGHISSDFKNCRRI